MYVTTTASLTTKYAINKLLRNKNRINQYQCLFDLERTETKERKKQTHIIITKNIMSFFL